MFATKVLRFTLFALLTTVNIQIKINIILKDKILMKNYKKHLIGLKSLMDVQIVLELLSVQLFVEIRPALRIINMNANSWI